MMKTTAFIMLLTACSVHCNMTSTCEGTCTSYLDDAINFISKAKLNIPNCCKSVNLLRQKPSDCTDVLQLGQNKSGVYEIWPINRITEKKSVHVYCDMDTTGGGWTVIQRRGDFKTPKDYFFRNWENYKEGFGNIEEDFWLGNDYIYALTNQKLYSVRFDLKDVEQNRRYALYDKFWVDHENNKYKLHISLYTGNAGDSMEYHNDQTFSTFDQDSETNCAKSRKGGWWYKKCIAANLNGLYYKGKNGNNDRDGISWYDWKGHDESLEWTEIKIRPKHFTATFSSDQHQNNGHVM